MAAKILVGRFCDRYHSQIHLSTHPLLKLQNFARNFTSHFPVLTFTSQSQYRKKVSLLDVFKRYGFPPSELPSFFDKNPYILDLRLNEVEKSLDILSSLNIPWNLAVSMIRECPGVIEYEFLKEWESVFTENGFLCLSPIGTINVIKWSRRSGVDAHKFGGVVGALKGLGFRDNTCCKIMEEFPEVIAMKEHEICEKVKFFKGMGIERDGPDYLFYRCPRILGFSVKDRLRPLLSEFQRICCNDHLMRKEILREPDMLCMELGELSRCLELLVTLKCREAIRKKILGQGEMRAAFELKLRVDCLCRQGLTHRDAFKVLWKEPRAILYQVEEIEKKIEYLLNTMKFDIHCLVDVPEYLGISFEKQIVPRYNVIEYLRSHGGLGDPVDLKCLIKISSLRFYNVYVKPYPECEKIFGRAEAAKGKGQYPVGLWKMFKPEQHAVTRRDVENIRCFMETLD